MPFGITLCGGDTTVSPAGPLMIAITAFGSVPHDRIVPRGGARPGDALYVSGTIGDAALGLKLRRGDAEARAWPLDEAARRYLIGRYLRPEPRLALREALLAHASAAMDVSDGLVIDCARMCRASGVGGRIEAAACAALARRANTDTGRCRRLRMRADRWRRLRNPRRDRPRRGAGVRDGRERRRHPRHPHRPVRRGWRRSCPSSVRTACPCASPGPATTIWPPDRRPSHRNGASHVFARIFETQTGTRLSFREDRRGVKILRCPPAE